MRFLDHVRDALDARFRKHQMRRSFAVIESLAESAVDASQLTGPLQLTDREFRAVTYRALAFAWSERARADVDRALWEAWGGPDVDAFYRDLGGES